MKVWIGGGAPRLWGASEAPRRLVPPPIHSPGSGAKTGWVTGGPPGGGDGLGSRPAPPSSPWCSWLWRGSVACSRSQKKVGAWLGLQLDPAFDPDPPPSNGQNRDVVEMDFGMIATPDKTAKDVQPQEPFLVNKVRLRVRGGG